MKRKIAALTLAVYLTGTFGTVYANQEVAPSTNEVTTESVATEETEITETTEETAVTEEEAVDTVEESVEGEETEQNEEVTEDETTDTEGEKVEIIVGEKEEGIVDEVVIEESAGILPNSIFYSIERGLENLQLAITRSEEKLGSLKAQFAIERAAEAAMMINEGEEELANEATAEYIGLLASATAHINNAIEAQEKAVQTLEALNEAYAKSEKILKMC